MLTLVVLPRQDNARFPHNLITVKPRKQGRRNPSNAAPAPNVMDEADFPDISFASGAVSGKPPAAGEGRVESARGGGGGGGGGAVGREDDDGGWWDGQGRIEDAEIVSGR